MGCSNDFDGIEFVAEKEVPIRMGVS